MVRVRFRFRVRVADGKYFGGLIFRPYGRRITLSNVNGSARSHGLISSSTNTVDVRCHSINRPSCCIASVSNETGDVAYRSTR